MAPGGNGGRRGGCALRALLLLLVALASPPGASHGQEPEPARLPLVRAASERDFPPLALVGPDGRADGFTVELFEAVAAAMDLDYEIEVGSFGDIKSNLATGRSDVLLNLAFSEERAREADFSVPHTRINGAIFVRRGYDRIRSTADLPGRSIGVLRGDLAHDWAAAQGWSAQITATDTTADAMRLLERGRVDCVLVAKLVGVVTLRELGLEDIVVTGAPVTEFAQKFSFAVSKGNTALLATLNEGLAIVMADGTFAALQDHWFGPYEPTRIRLRDMLVYSIPVVLLIFAVLVAMNRRLVHVTRALRATQEQLEGRVSERTHELAEANASLEAEVAVRRDVEARLRRALSLEEATLESTQDGIVAVDREGRIERFNETFAKMSSIPPAALTARDDHGSTAFLLEELLDPGAVVDRLRQIYAQPEAESFDVLHFKDGRVFERYSKPQRVDGVPAGRVWSFRDVTERARAEQRFRELAETIDDVFWMSDPIRRKLLYVSPAFERVFGRPSSKAFQNAEEMLEVVHPADRDLVRESFERIRHGEPTSTEFRVFRPDGTMRWLWDRSFPVQNSRGEVIRANGITSDVTERRRAESERQVFERRLQQMQRLEGLGLLAGGIAHDFNNLLTGVLGNASLARAILPQTPELHEPLEQIETIAMRAAELCRQLLAYAGKGTFSEARVDLNAVVEDTLQLLHVSIAKGVTLHWRPATRLPPVNADASQVRQILMNLVINASEAIGERGGVVTVSTGVTRPQGACLADLQRAAEPPPEECVFLEVVDDGCGMDAATRERIFDPFFTTKFTGRGLGLAAVLGIVRRHHGALEVESEPGRGARFRVLLPATEGTTEPSASGPPPLPLHGRGLVLVVEDEALVRKVVVRMLESAGYEVLVATDGLEGVETFRAHAARLDAVVLDLTMPGLDGRSALREMRALRSEVPVLVMTGYSEQEAIERFEGREPDALLRKPFRPAELLERLSALLGVARYGD